MNEKELNKALNETASILIRDERHPLWWSIDWDAAQVRNLEKERL